MWECTKKVSARQREQNRARRRGRQTEDLVGVGKLLHRWPVEWSVPSNRFIYISRSRIYDKSRNTHRRQTERARHSPHIRATTKSDKTKLSLTFGSRRPCPPLLVRPSCCYRYRHRRRRIDSRSLRLFPISPCVALPRGRCRLLPVRRFYCSRENSQGRKAPASKTAAVVVVWRGDWWRHPPLPPGPGLWNAVLFAGWFTRIRLWERGGGRKCSADGRKLKGRPRNRYSSYCSALLQYSCPLRTTEPFAKKRFAPHSPW